MAKEGDREEGETAPADDSHIAEMARKAIQEAAAGLVVDQGGGGEGGGGEPETVDVEIDGTKYKMPKDQAEALNRQQAAYESNLTTAQTAEDQEETKQEEGTDYQTLFYTNPDEAVTKIKDEIREELRGEYLQDKALDIFWQDFYTENPELREEDGFVRMVLGNKMSELKDLKGKTGRDGLAKAVQTELLRIQNKNRGGTGKETKTVNLEGGLPGSSEAEPESTEASTPAKVSSIGDAIKERNITRRKAAGKSA